MTTEERFKKLLQIACDNGYTHDKMTIGIDKDLNNLILNTNFFECLFKRLNTSKLVTNSNIVLLENIPDTICYEMYFPVTSWSQYYKFQWVLEVEKGTALEWLFKQFGI